MSETIDRKVVEMEFDNRRFEQNVATSLSTIDKLKSSLNLEGVTKGFENIDAAAGKVDMNTLSNSVEAVSVKFSALRVMAMTALSNITNSVVNLGKKMIRSFAIEPLKQGFGEYELKMGSIQTIMASTGEDLKTVNKYLGELNDYADKTIYSFSDMTSNIGKFTNAGVNLKDSVKAIQGVSNVAAISGANTNEASRAMYNFAQALSAGYVKLIDWKSIENANMATVSFKNELLKTALACGTVKKEGDKYVTLTTDAKGKTSDAFDATHNFNDALQNQWMTTEVLVKTLNRYSDETTEIGKKAFAAAKDVKTFTQLVDTLKEAIGTGWADTWEILFGDFEEAKKLWTSISEVLGDFVSKSAKARNSLLQGWKDLGGRQLVIDTLTTAFKRVVDVIKPIKEAFQEVFPPVTAKNLYNITKSLSDFVNKIKMSDKTFDNLKRTFKGLFSLLDIGWQLLKNIIKPFGALLGITGNLGGGLLSVTAKIGDWITKLDELVKSSKVFETVFGGISKVIKKLIELFKEKIATPGFEYLSSLLERIKARMGWVSDAGKEMKDKISKSFNEMGNSIKKSPVVSVLKTIFTAIKKLATALFSSIGGLMSKMKDINFNKLLDGVNSAGLGVIIYKIIKVLNGAEKATEGFGNALKEISDLPKKIGEIFTSLKGCLEEYQKSIKAKKLKDIAIAIAILAASLLVISLIDSDKLAQSIAAITAMFVELMGAMAVFNKIGDKTGKGVSKASRAMLIMSAAIAILATAMVKVGSLDWGGVARGIVGIGALMAMMLAFTKILSSNTTTKLVKGIGSLILLAFAIRILAKAMIQLAELSWSGIAKGVVGIGALVAMMTAFTKILSSEKTSKLVKGIGSLVLFAFAIKILASACKDLAELSWGELAKGLIGVSTLIAVMAGAVKLMSNSKNILQVSIGIIIIAEAIKILSQSVTSLGGLSWDALARGLLGIAGSLGAIVLALNFIPKDILKKAVGLIVVAKALEILSGSLIELGKMSWESFAKGLLALGISLGIIVAALKLLDGSLGAVATLFVAALAIKVITKSMQALGSMSWESIIKSLVTLAATFTIIGIAAAVLEPLLPAILGLAAAFTLMGIAVLATGVGLMAAGAGLSAIAVGIYALVAALAFGTETIVAALSAIVVGVADLIPLLIQKIGEGLIALCQVIIDGAPAIGEAVKAVLLQLLVVVFECIPVVVEGLLKLIISLLDMLIQHGPEIVERIFEFLIAIINALAAKIPDLIQAAVNLLMSFFEGVVSALKSIDPEILIKGIAGVGLLTALMLALAAVAAITPLAMVGVLGIGAVLLELIAVIAAIGAISQLPGLKWLISEGGEMLGLVGQAIGKFVGGFVAGFADMMIGQLVAMAVELSMFMVALQPFLAGVKMVDASSFDGMKALADVILMLTAANIIDGLTKWFTGGTSLAKFGEELANFAPYFKQYYDHIKGIDGSVVEASANAAKTLSEMANNLPKEGGVVSWFEGENSLITFAEGLANFGHAMKSYAASVSGLSVDDINISVAAAKAISEMAAGLPNQGGVKSWFEGDNTLSDIAIGLAAFGPALATYTTSVAGLDLETVRTSVEVAKMISDMAANLPNQGGVSSWFEGDNTLSTIAEELVSFGPALVNYADSVKGLNPEEVSGAMDIAKSLVELISAMPNLGGTDSWTNGDQSLEKLGEELYYFGPYLKQYSESVNGIAVTAVNNSLSIIKSAFEVLKNIPDIEEGKLETIGKELSAFGPAIKGYVDSISEIDTSKLDSFGDQFSKSAQSGINQFVNTFSNSNTKVSNSATKIITTFSKGITDGKDKVDGSMKNIASSALSALSRYVSDHYDNIYGYGNYAVEGFAKGISDNDFKAEAKARAMALKALEAAKKALDEHSPSKKFYKVGAFAGIALVNAFSDFGRKVYNASYNMADYANKGLGKAIQKISDLVDGNLDLQPVISPVIDLDNVRAGARTLNGLLDTPTLALTTRIGMINTDMNGRQTDLSNKDVVRAIDGLRSDIRNRPQYVYNVDGVTYDGTSDVATAVEDLANAIKVGRRV